MPDRIIDYTILSADDSIKLTALVRELIARGWQPHGGLQNRSYHENGILLQAMIKRREPAE